MAVNKVEYKLASTTEGFAQAGDTVQIKLSNAKTIQKDVEEGCTEDLSNATQRFLDIRVQHSTEETDYEGGEEGGEDELGEGEEGEIDSEKNSSPSSNGSVAGLLFGQGALAGTTALHAFMYAPVAPYVGTIAVGLGTVSLALSTNFDNSLNQRTTEAAAAGDYIGEIQEYEEIMNTDIETMTNVMDELEAEEGAEGAEAEGEAEGTEEGATEDTGELESLQAELEQAQADGDEEKAAEIQAKIDEITAGLAKGTEDTEDPIAEIQMNNELAHSVEADRQKTSQFLMEGKNLGTMAVMNTTQLTGCAVNSGILAAEAFRLNPLGIFTPEAIAGSVMSGIAAGMFTTAATMMTVKSVKEFNAASKGSDISSEINNMQDPLQQHDELIESLISKQDEQSSGDAGESGSTTGSEGSGGSSSSAPASSASTGGSSSGGSSSGGSSSTSA